MRTAQITNAAKFEEGGGVEVRVRCVPGVPPPRDGDAAAGALSACAIADAAAPTHTLEATVSDHGRGMTPAECERVFGAYEAAAASKGGGSGLGLYISRACARRAGGDVSVISTPGKGAQFIVRFPVRVASEDWAAVAAAAACAVQPSVLPPPPELLQPPPTTPAACAKRAHSPSCLDLEESQKAPPPPPQQQLRCLLADDHRLNLLVRSHACCVRLPRCPHTH